MEGNPQNKGITLKTRVVTPKKPNSARRPVAKISLMNSNSLVAHVPGIGHNLRKHSLVLVRGGNTRDLPGVQHKCIRGVYDLANVLNRFTRRSLYGVKIPEDATDEPLTNDELPYLELFYRFKNNAGYDLALTRHVHAQASVVSEERSGVCVRGDETQHAPHCTTTSGAADATGERGGGGTTDHEADSADTATAHDVHWQRYADNYGQAALVVALIPDFEDT